MDKIQETLLWKVLDASALQWIGLFVALVLLVGLIVRIRAWFREETDAAADDHQLLTSVSEMHREGDLTEDEYRSIKGRLVRKLGDHLRAEE